MLEIVWWGQPKPKKRAAQPKPSPYGLSNPHPRWLDPSYFSPINLHRRNLLHAEHARKMSHER